MLQGIDEGGHRFICACAQHDGEQAARALEIALPEGMAWVRWQGGVHHRLDLRPLLQPLRDAQPRLIGPGFVDLDALSDLDTTILGFDNSPAWRKGRIWPDTYMQRGPYEMYTPDELAFQKRYAFAQLIDRPTAPS